MDPVTASLVQVLDEEIFPLNPDPLLWQDPELAFLIPSADKSVIGLGEATHGTSEFFKAKHRIFRYLVENHGFKIFAIEADFGESLLINDAIQRGAADEIPGLMKKMHFWTWKAKEVQSLLEWMCSYNIGKSKAEKVHYMGIDCQANTYHPGLLKEYLIDAGSSFFSNIEAIIVEADAFSRSNFSSYSSDQFDEYRERLDALEDSLIAHKDELIVASSKQEYELNKRLVRVIKQVSVFNVFYQYGVSFRDKYMAENVVWLKEYFDSEKMVVWAHNVHVSDNLSYYNYHGGTMGHHLKEELQNDYAIIGLLFSKGSFKAAADNPFRLKTHTISEEPKSSSINYILTHSSKSAFSFDIEDLLSNDEWNSALNNNLQTIQIGSSFNGRMEDYYYRLEPSYFSSIIYFDETSAATY